MVSYLKRIIGGVCLLAVVFAFSPAQVKGDKAPQVNRIAFSWNVDGDFEIYAMDEDGGNLAQLTVNDSDDLSPAWSPDGNQIAYTSNIDGPWDIYIMDANGGNITNFTNSDWDELYPAWSPDGEHIAYTGNTNGNWDIYAKTTVGGTAVRVTDSNQYDGNPAWSPDGNYIAYVTGRESAREIKVLDLQNNQIISVTNNGQPDTNPVWSPLTDTLSLAFIEKPVQENPQVYVLIDFTACVQSGSDCEGQAQRVTFDAGGVVDPAWSPDGQHIIFGTGRDGDNTELYTMEPDGNNQIRLTFSNSDKRFPSWWGVKSNQ